MLEVRTTTRFKKELNKAARQQKDMQKLGAAVACFKLKNLFQSVT